MGRGTVRPNGKRIAELRALKGLSQEALANLVGVTRETISRLERERTETDIAVLQVIAEKVGLGSNQVEQLVKSPGAAAEPERAATPEGGAGEREVYIRLVVNEELYATLSAAKSEAGSVLRARWQEVKVRGVFMGSIIVIVTAPADVAREIVLAVRNGDFLPWGIEDARIVRRRKRALVGSGQAPAKPRDFSSPREREALKAGDPKVWRAFATEWLPWLVQRSMRGNQPADAEDIAHSAFVKAWQFIDQYDPARPIGPWLMKIARREAIDRARRRTREVLVSPRRSNTFPAREPTPPRRWATTWQELAADLGAERARLTKDDWRLLWMRFGEGRKLREIGALNLDSIFSVRRRVQRALGALRQLLEEDGITGPE